MEEITKNRELWSEKRRTKMDTETKKDSYHIDTVYTLLDMTEWKTQWMWAVSNPRAQVLQR
jgi:hypothetical protein